MSEELYPEIGLEHSAGSRNRIFFKNLNEGLRNLEDNYKDDKNHTIKGQIYSFIAQRNSLIQCIKKRENALLIVNKSIKIKFVGKLFKLITFHVKQISK